MYLPLDSRSPSIPNISELHSEGLRFQCTPSLLWNCSSSKRLSPNHCPTTLSTFQFAVSLMQPEGTVLMSQKWLKVFPSIGRRRVGKALFQARNRFHITVHPVKISFFAGKYITLRVHGITPCRTRVTGWSDTVRVTTFCVRRRTDRT